MVSDVMDDMVDELVVTVELTTLWDEPCDECNVGEKWSKGREVKCETGSGGRLRGRVCELADFKDTVCEFDVKGVVGALWNTDVGGSEAKGTGF